MADPLDGIPAHLRSQVHADEYAYWSGRLTVQEREQYIAGLQAKYDSAQLAVNDLPSSKLSEKDDDTSTPKEHPFVTRTVTPPRSSDNPLAGVVPALRASKATTPSEPHEVIDTDKLSPEARQWLERQADAGATFKSMEDLNAAFIASQRPDYGNPPDSELGLNFVRDSQTRDVSPRARPSEHLLSQVEKVQRALNLSEADARQFMEATEKTRPLERGEYPKARVAHTRGWEPGDGLDTPSTKILVDGVEQQQQRESPEAESPKREPTADASKGMLPRKPTAFTKTKRSKKRGRKKKLPEPEKPKPVDRWLGLGAVVAGILLFLFAKTPAAVVICVLAMFGLLLHPAWRFWWIEKRPWRQVISVVLLGATCICIGYLAWPTSTTSIQAKDSNQTKTEALSLTRRTLTSEQRSRFVKALKELQPPRDVIRVTCPPADEEACVYASQLLDAFEEAGYAVKGRSIERTVVGKPVPGIVLGGYTPAKDMPPPGLGVYVLQSPTLIAVEKAFGEIGLETTQQAALGGPERELIVSVGIKP